MQSQNIFFLFFRTKIYDLFWRFFFLFVDRGSDRGSDRTQGGSDRGSDRKLKMDLDLDRIDRKRRIGSCPAEKTSLRKLLLPGRVIKTRTCFPTQSQFLFSMSMKNFFTTCCSSPHDVPPSPVPDRVGGPVHAARVLLLCLHILQPLLRGRPLLQTPRQRLRRPKGPRQPLRRHLQTAVLLRPGKNIQRNL